ncbi:hypothetical protein PG985_007582 [Apiospora marii]|uniref:DUF6604 domain-containing protein n=1 Tax=Apiospora marii TaxID=335849 RepID=A0ABR1SN78_9PEZI
MAETKLNRPPLSDFVVKYRQYKDDTLNISAWLAENALKCGFDIKAAAATPSTAKVGGNRLKGKDRKKAKEAAAKASLAVAVSGPQYIIQVSHSPALSRLFHHVIEARRQFGTWYAGPGGPGAKASDERHTYFVDVLQATWDVLVPFKEARKTFKPSPKASGGNKSKGDLLFSLDNRFANLHVESPIEFSGSHAASTPPSSDNESYRLPTSINVEVQRDEDDIEWDFLLGIHTFLCELGEARSYIEDAWIRVATEPSRITQAAVQSNLVIQIVRRAEMSLGNLERPKRFPASTYPTWTFPFIIMFERTGYLHPSILEILPPEARLDNITNPDFSAITDRSISTFDIAGDWASFCFAKPFIVFHYAIHRSKYMNGVVSPGGLDAHFWCSDKDELEIFETFNRIQTVALTSDGGMAEDEVTGGVRVATETKTVPIWSVFGFQCLLDINSILKNSESAMIGGPLFELQRHISMAAKNLNDIDIERLKPPFGPTPPQIEDLTRLIDGIKDEVFNGSLTEQVTSIPSGQVPFYLSDPDFYLEYNPIRCGLMQYNLRLQLHERALAFDTELIMLVPMIHLYKMCRLVYPGMPAWPDMEFLLLHQDVDRLFFGGVPTSLTETTSKYALAMGMSATALSKMKRTGRMKSPNLDRMRFAQNTCPIGSILSASLGGYAHDDDMVLLELLRWLNDPKRMELVEYLLERQLRPSAEASEADDTPFQTAEEEKQRMYETYNSSRTSISDTLFFSDLFLESERDVLNFDWVSFMYTANEMAKHVSSILGRHYPDKYREYNGLFCTMLMELMAEAEGAERQASTNGCKSPTLAEFAPPALKEICDAMQAKGLVSVSHDKREVNTKSGKQEAVWWAMDRGIASLIRRYDFTAVSFLTASEQFLREHLYQNWPAQDLERSYTILRSRAFHGKLNQKGKLDEEWVECDADAQVWVDVDSDDEDGNDGNKNESSDRRQQSDSFEVKGYLRGLLCQNLRCGGVEVEQQFLDHHMDSLMQHITQDVLDAFSSPQTVEDREIMLGMMVNGIEKVFKRHVKDEGLQDVEGWLRGIVRQCLRSGGRGVAVNEEEVLDGLMEKAMGVLTPEYLTMLQMPQTKGFRDEVAASLSAALTKVVDEIFPPR